MTSSSQPRSDVYQRVTDQIIAQLERGTVPWHKPWQTGRASLPLRHNGEAYRGINVLSLWVAASDAGYGHPVWMTYRQALELGGQVRKGEKGTTVIYSGTLALPGDESGEGEDAREVRYAKAYSVFNVAQIDGLSEAFAKPMQEPLDEGKRDARLEAFFSAVGARTEHGGSSAYYAPTRDVIQLPPFSAFVDAASYYAVRAHETVHWTGHASRLARLDDGDRYGSPAYAKEELVAEIGSAFLCTHLVVTPELRADHVSYIEHWLGILKQDKRAIFAAAAHAQRAADFLLARACEAPG